MGTLGVQQAKKQHFTIVFFLNIIMADWKVGLFTCFGDFKLCLFTWCCPCMVTGKIAEHIEMDTCFWGGCKIFIPCYNILYMKQMRDQIAQKSGIPDEGIMGWINVCCFGLCSIIQETKELGLDPMAKAMGEQQIDRV